MKRPLGKLFVGAREDVANVLLKEVGELIACVGDFVSGTALDLGLKTLIYIVDSKIERNSVPLHLKLRSLPRHHLYNPPGLINADAWPLISTVMSEGKTAVILVEGEEDLLTLPVIDIAPVGSKILYGQPREGAVIVNVDQALKHRVKEMLRAMPTLDSP